MKSFGKLLQTIFKSSIFLYIYKGTSFITQTDSTSIFFILFTLIKSIILMGIFSFFLKKNNKILYDFFKGVNYFSGFWFQCKMYTF